MGLLLYRRIAHAQELKCDYATGSDRRIRVAGLGWFYELDGSCANNKKEKDKKEIRKLKFSYQMKSPCPSQTSQILSIQK